MKITKVVCAKGRTGFYFDDQKAIKKGAVVDGNMYVGDPATSGFTSIRQAGEAISVMLILENGEIGWGDCAAVQYSGAGGRDPLFLAEKFIPIIEKAVAEHLVGQEADSFKRLAKEIDTMEFNGKRLHTAIRYGVSQAILDTVAKANKLNMCDVIAKEYGTKINDGMLPIFTQSGDERYTNADKMIMKGAQVLPHGLFNSVAKLGQKGEKLIEYIEWLRDRVQKFAPHKDYHPIFHIDCYGTIGMVFGPSNYADMAVFLKKAVEAAKPFHLRIEGPMDSDGREAQMRDLAGLTAEVDARGIDVELVADEWCNTLEDIVYFADNKSGHMIQIKTPDLGSIHNTVEAVLYCKEKGVGAYQGGTCNETDRSAQVCIHCAMAANADQVLAKPGMGVDEGYMIVYNEMNRILALRKAGIGV
ncbi:MAG: methylaspartate ammonia-lyase [Eubacteriales bacterium]|jgi:methylaspartate ammonia-lyase|nr:methylaspartate ammonia-lyase [Eubacteriales bacterium]MDD4104575.1 methylaspartate ammonia-lyase [Eubacteriales bacterium]MDD4710735.1 methylaspartate ammonia-lyase [Eubacteriales bacterium]